MKVDNNCNAIRGEIKQHTCCSPGIVTAAFSFSSNCEATPIISSKLPNNCQHENLNSHDISTDSFKAESNRVFRVHKQICSER